MDPSFETLSKSLLDYEGEGNIFFEDGTCAEVNFTLWLLVNGRVELDLSFESLDPYVSDHINNMKFFTLKGKENDKLSCDIVAKKCFMNSFSTHQSLSNSTVTISGNGLFSCQNVVFFRENDKRKPTEELLIKFGVINVYRVHQVRVNTKMGVLFLRHYDNMNQSIRIMHSYRLPLITSSIELVAKPDGNEELGNILDNAIEIIEDFLKVTTLSQGVWHDWAFVSVYQKDASNYDSDRFNFIYQKFTTPILKVPSLHPITPVAYSNQFIDIAYKGFRRELEERYGFNIALEWYIESNIEGPTETKFLNATTCLELLMDKLLSYDSNREYLFDNDSFDIFYRCLSRHARSILRKMLYSDNKQYESVVNSLKQTQRRSFTDKVRMLLDYWGICIDDTKIKLSDIRRLRNKITHEGKYHAQNDRDIEYLIRVYNGLKTILTRVFLAMLNYDGFYQDFGIEYNNKDSNDSTNWIRFSDVCKKIGAPCFSGN